MALSGNQRAYLKAEAHELEPLLTIGKNEIDADIYTELDNLLRTRELVKVKVLPNSQVPVKDIASDLAENCSAEVVQVIGRKIVLYKFSEDLAKKGKTKYFPAKY